jgi:hypothetical protein
MNCAQEGRKTCRPGPLLGFGKWPIIRPIPRRKTRVKKTRGKGAAMRLSRVRDDFPGRCITIYGWFGQHKEIPATRRKGLTVKIKRTCEGYGICRSVELSEHQERPRTVLRETAWASLRRVPFSHLAVPQSSDPKRSDQSCGLPDAWNHNMGTSCTF